MDGELLVKMLSPMTMSSILKTAYVRTKQYYYSPLKDFSTLMEQNARKKHEAFHKTPVGGLKLEVTLSG